MKPVLKTIGAFLLIFVSIVLFAVLTVASLLYSLITLVHHKEFARTINGFALYFLTIALANDQLGNVVFSGFLTYLFIDKTKLHLAYKFGDADETISEVLGWNEHLGTLSKRGQKFAKLLSALDKNHCEGAMLSGIEKASIKIEFAKQLKLVA